MGKRQTDSDFQLVIRRALELADLPATAGGPVEPVSLMNLPADAVQEVAAELGIDESALAQALAEHATGTRRARPLSDRLLGPSQVAASHRCGFAEHSAQQRLEAWLERGHGLRTRTTSTGVVVGNRRRGAVGLVANTARRARGDKGLSTSREVRASAVTVGERSTGLSVVADLSDQRAKSVAAGAVTTASTASVAAVVMIFTPVGLVGVPVALAAGYAVTRLTHRRTVRRFADEVELTVDAVAAGAEPQGAASKVASRLRSRHRYPGSPS